MPWRFPSVCRHRPCSGLRARRLPDGGTGWVSARLRLARRSPGLDRKLDGERRALTQRALDGQRPPVLADDAVRDAEAEAGAVALRRDERIEHLGDDVGGNAGAGVLHLDADPRVTRAPHADAQAARTIETRHRLLGVG